MRKLKPIHIIIIGYLILILIGAGLLALPASRRGGGWLNFTDALFASASAVCLTGLSTLPASAFSIFGQVILLLLVQLGGLGITVAATMFFIIIHKKITLGERLTMQEALSEDNASGLNKVTRNIVIVTLAAEIIGALLIMPPYIKSFGAEGVFQAFFTAVNAFCNTGLGVSTAGFAANPLVLIPIILLSVLGGIGFPVIFDAARTRGFKKLTLHSKITLISTLALILSGTALFMLFEYSNPATIGGENFGVKLLNCFFTSASSRSAGFTVFNPADASPGGRSLIAFFMLVGNSPVSTGGGIRPASLAVFVLIIIACFKNTGEVTADKRTLSRKTVNRVTAVAVFLIAAALALSFALFITEAGNAALNEAGLYNTENIIFESISALDAGMTLGVTPFLSAAGKYCVMLVMFLGRVGPLSIGLLLMRKDNTDSLIKYPEGNLIVS